MTFDPRRVSYPELLEVFWGGQPTDLPPGPSRVRLAIIPRTGPQLALATESKRRRYAAGGRPSVEILPGADFWPAERLHQKFTLQRAYAPLVAELAVGFPDLDAFLASTAAARLNAYVSGNGEATLAAAARELALEVPDLRRRLDRDAEVPVSEAGRR